VNFKTVKNYTKAFLRGFLFAFFYFAQVKVHAFDVDLSRRQPASMNPAPAQNLNGSPDALIKAPTKNLISQPQTAANQEFITRQNDTEILKALKKAVLPSDPTNEIVILNTETGFIPEKVRIRKGETYKVHIVNLNMKEKNVSFLMDSFTQSHNTVYGVKKTFNIEPQVEGIYSYQCPETGIQGQMIVVTEPNEKFRKPSSVSATKDSEE
jgi:plastocyanin